MDLIPHWVCDKATTTTGIIIPVYKSKIGESISQKISMRVLANRINSINHYKLILNFMLTIVKKSTFCNNFSFVK